MEISEVNFSNLGFLKVILSDDDVKPIVYEVEQLQKNFDDAVRFNQGLAGHLNNEYYLFECKTYMESLLLPLVYEYKDKFSHFECKEKGYFLENVWVNYQKKHEFNPVHHHSGVFSFAMWLKIPYSIEDEYKTFPHILQHENITANFCFQYTDVLGDIQRYPIPADKSWENMLVFFPSKLRHFVNPFYTSDDYRISVSGNFA